MQGPIHKRIRTYKNGRKSMLWYVVVDLPRGAEGERRQKWHGGFQSKKAAEAVKARLVHELTTGFYVELSRMLLSEWPIDHRPPVHKTRGRRRPIGRIGRRLSITSTRDSVAWPSASSPHRCSTGYISSS